MVPVSAAVLKSFAFVARRLIQLPSWHAQWDRASSTNANLATPIPTASTTVVMWLLWIVIAMIVEAAATAEPNVHAPEPDGTKF